LKIHEELLFHNLSILAIIPSKRADLLDILDTHGQRQHKPIDEADYDLVGQTEKRLKKMQTIVDIPIDAKLIRANTMMLELFV
jgi:hypothetical protein